MTLDTLDALLIEQLQDIYYAEKHLVKALPRMARAANAPELRQAFTDHLAQTREHVARLEQAFEALEMPARGKKCPAIEGLIQEAAEMLDESGEPSVLDAGIIASAQRVEHYEIAAYGGMRVIAEALGHDRIVALLDQTLAEEQGAADLLTDLTGAMILPAALAAQGDTEAADVSDTRSSMGRQHPTRPGRRPGDR